MFDGITPPAEHVAVGPGGTGKSMGALGALMSIASIYPRIPGRVLLTRQTRKSMTSSTCVTIRKLMPERHPMFGALRDDHRSSYEIGRWQFVLMGMSDPENQLSTEWDFVFADELRQFSLGPYEQFHRGLRNYALYQYDADGRRAKPGHGVSKIPFGMIIGATNPGKPKHWIRSRARSGRLHLVESRIEDNPAYFDDDGRINPVGEAYFKQREHLSGVRYRRLVLGEWCAAEGLIYPEWEGDPAVPNGNVVRLPRGADGWVSMATLREMDVRQFFAGMDFGDNAPGAFVLAAYTGDKRLIVIAEVYARKKTIAWWVDRVVEIHKHYPLTLCFCDHNNEGMMQALNDALGAAHDGPGAVFVKADKGRDRGIALVRRRIAERRLTFDVDALTHAPDETLVEYGLPVQTTEELDEYIHKLDSDEDEVVHGEKAFDIPDPKCHDHGCDATRYLVIGVDYYHPSGPMASPDRRLYLDRLRAQARALRGRGEYRDPDEDKLDAFDEVDEAIDEIRRSLN